MCSIESKVRLSALVVVLLALGSVWQPLSAVAGEGADRAAAKEMFFEGLELFQNDEYPEALAVFEKSYRLNPKGSVLLNIAMCQKAMYLSVEALQSHQRNLDHHGAELKPHHKEAIRNEIVDLEKLVARVRIVNAPDGSTVKINGRPVAEGSGPNPVLVNPGVHVVEVTKAGFAPYNREVKVDQGAEIALDASLEPKLVPSPAAAAPAPEEQRDSSTGWTPTPRDGKRLDTQQILALTLLGGGAVASIVGGVFTYQYFSDRNAAADARERYNSADNPSEEDERIYNDAMDQLPTDKAAMALCYVSAAALVTSGVIMLVYHHKKKNRPSLASAPTIQPHLGGLSVVF